MEALLQQWLAWPAFPFSVLLGLVTAYWILVILGAMDLDLLDIDIDMNMDADVDASLADWGMIGVKWFNLGDVPFMLWVSMLALASWSMSVYYDKPMPNATNYELATVIIRNLALGLLAAKILTQPLKGKLKHKEPNTIKEMIGRTCIVISNEVNQKHGTALCTVEDGAPLQLHVRTVEGTVHKDDVVEIIDFVPETGVYFVQCIETNK